MIGYGDLNKKERERERNGWVVKVSKAEACVFEVRSKGTKLGVSLIRVTSSLKFSGEEISVTDQLNGRPPDELIQVGVPRVLERPASSLDPAADSREAKKAKIDDPARGVGSGACDMDADLVPDPAVLGANLSPVETKAGTNKEVPESNGNGILKQAVSYAQATAAGLNREGWFEDEQSLNTEEVVVLDEDCEISEEEQGLGREDDTEVPNVMNDQDVSKKEMAQAYVRRQHVPGKGIQVEGGRDKDGNRVEIIALDPVMDLDFEENTISQGKGKHVALKIFEKGDSSYFNAKPKAGSVGFKVGKAGKENVLSSLKIRNRSESRSFEKALGVRGFDEDDPGNSRVENAMEEQPAAVGIDVDAEIGMRS
ncbi:hypothetical protein V6N12_049866 [Hibiscus sabdariffa]|uniref:Uncharacterized protein n=1 Tax=Hibiscus sabdariffa TaxID=183260 RepID=A0ABR2GCG8_9ROSI